MVAFVIYHTTAPMNFAWLYVTLVCFALVPALGWIAKSPIRRRFAVAFVVVVALGGGLALAQIQPPPGWTADCCDWLLAYGICWPIGWWGC